MKTFHKLLLAFCLALIIVIAVLLIIIRKSQGGVSFISIKPGFIWRTDTQSAQLFKDELSSVMGTNPKIIITLSP